MNRSDDKFLLVVGTLGWFADSIRIFAEKGYRCFFHRSRPSQHFAPNYGYFEKLRFTEVGGAFDEIDARAFGSGGVVISGNHWEPHGQIYPKIGEGDEVTLADHERAARLLRARGVQLLSVRMLNGDTLFTDAVSRTKFEALNRQTDLFVADSRNVERYVKTQCPGLRDRRFVVSPVDVPLTRFTQIAEPAQSVDQCLHSGRLVATALPKIDRPVLYLPPQEDQTNPPPYAQLVLRRRFAVAGVAPLAQLEYDRTEVSRLFGRFRAGLGHFYDFLTSNASDDLDALYRADARLPQRQIVAGGYDMPAHYRLTNTASKVLMYLMMGLPPIVPADRDNDFHQKLIDLDMCIPVGRDGVIPKLSPARLSQVRFNVRANTQVYTFNPTFTAIDAHRAEMLAHPENFGDRATRGSAAIVSTPAVTADRCRTDRFLLVVGSLCWFNDSYRIFTEQGYRCFFKRTKCMWWQAKNYDQFIEMGFTELTDPVEQLADAGFAGGMVISGLCYEPHQKLYADSGTDAGQIEEYSRVATGLKARGLNVLAARLCNGDTMFTDDQAVEHFQRHNEVTDVLFFDNAGAERFVRHHCPKLRDKPFVTMPLEGPLKRFVHARTDPGLDDAWLYMGRPASSKVPEFPGQLILVPGRLKTPNTGRFANIFARTRFFPAGFGSLYQVDLERQLALETFGKCRGGISHFYDYFTVDPDLDPEPLFAERSDRQKLDCFIGDEYFLPRHYRVTNVASKAITYLMIGLPPVIPADPANPFHRQLMEHEMCIPVGRDGVVPRLSEEQTLRICRNIADHPEIFTFDAAFATMDRMCTEFLARARAAA